MLKFVAKFCSQKNQILLQNFDKFGMKKTIALIILDGWGVGRSDQSNPIFAANLQNINHIKANFPLASLQASGIASGIPWGEEGNSEIGHLTIGAGKVVYQNYPMITISVRNGSFFQNETIKKVFKRAKEKDSAVHLIGLLSDGNVHASLEHLSALIQFAEKESAPPAGGSPSASFAGAVKTTLLAPASKCALASS